ncbi:lysoplasmalogenase [Mycobacterium parmense]|nr:lysoplasmalogenase [Mycobacterium parmense]MCV7351862.1 lysoplasmalogenase [Mycobacterium parmense]
MEVPYAPRLVAGGWVVAGWAGLSYGVYLTVLALRSPPGTELTGHWILQPPFKALMALLLTVAALGHPIVRERRWLVPALLLSATGDWLLAIPWWTLSFVVGLASFLLAHLCFLAALLPLATVAAPSRPRIAAVALICLATLALLAWFWPHLSRDQLTIPVTAYILVLTAMVCTAQLARLPTIWTAVGAICFALSDAMIGIGRFILDNQALSVPVWWLYAAAQVLITAGFFFGREESVLDEGYEDDDWEEGAQVVDWPAEGFE